MDINRNLAEVRQQIAAAASKSGRNEDEIVMVAVTKTWSAETVTAAYEAGLRHFGENRAQELAAKKLEVDDILVSASGIIWHAIGDLQSRKTTIVADNADVFHALDREKIARRISHRLVETKRADSEPLPVFIEVNISGEASKAGVDCGHWEENQEQRERLMALAQRVQDLPGLQSLGLMTMAPWQVDEAIIRKTFQRTRLLSEWLQGQFPDAEWSRLSMGMTDDFEIAIEEGATHIRVGRAIFGERG